MDQTLSFQPELIHTPEQLELLASQAVEGFIIGLHKSPFHGFSVEFAEHRLYNPGEPTKNLDWKVFARSDRMYIKRFEEETNLRCQLVIDQSSSMFYPMEKGRLSKYQFSILCAAALVNLLQRQRDASGLSLFSDTIRLQTEARSSRVHRQMIYTRLTEQLHYEEKSHPSEMAKCLHQIAENIHRRSLVILFSDMLDCTDEQKAGSIYEALRHLRFNRHEVVLFQVTDHTEELDFIFDDRPYEFIDLESGEKIKIQPNQLKSSYLEKMEAFRHQLRLKCGQSKIDLHEADIRKGFQPVLSSFLTKRSRMKR